MRSASIELFIGPVVLAVTYTLLQAMHRCIHVAVGVAYGIALERML